VIVVDEAGAEGRQRGEKPQHERREQAHPRPRPPVHFEGPPPT
jgi:hypothetical protein